MAVFNVFFATILLPLITIVLLWRRPRRPRLAWSATLLMAAGVTAFSFLAAPWGWYGLPLRSVVAGLFVVALVVSLRRPMPEELTEESAARSFVKVAIGVFFGGVAIGVLRAHAVPPRTLDLGFPLAHGTFLVAHGGSAPAANMHFQTDAQRYAVDFVKLNAAGMHARGINPVDPRAHAIFGVPVLSPCEGSVVAAVDGFADASPDPEHALGNEIAIRCGDAVVHLAQLERGSVAVNAGQRVARGAAVARAGHSGLSIEPHLHIHAERDGVAVPITFEGRWLVRNAVVHR